MDQRLFDSRKPPLGVHLPPFTIAGMFLLAAACSDADSDGHAHSHDSHDHSHDLPTPPQDAGLPPDGSITGNFAWNLPVGLTGYPVVPQDNPMSNEKVDLGRFLFYDTRLSGNETFSCASCHKQELAFADDRAVGHGSTGEDHRRGSMSLANVGYAQTLTWANPKLTTLEEQAFVPIFGHDPIELGLADEADAERRLREVALYQDKFAKAFPGDEQPTTARNMAKALSAFQRVLISGNSPYDRGELSESAQRGQALFEGHPFECFHCHAPPHFTEQATWEGKYNNAPQFRNTGLYNIGGTGAYPEGNGGVFEVTKKQADMGFFKAPTLRNIAVTAPYMHDGSIKDLQGVLEHYVAGGRTIADGPNAGVGSKNPHKDKLVPGFKATQQDIADVIEFLKSLTDEEFLTNPAFSDPWK